MTVHSYLLCKVFGWESNSSDSPSLCFTYSGTIKYWCFMEKAIIADCADLSTRWLRAQIHKRIFPWRAFSCRLLLWAEGDEGSANAKVLSGAAELGGSPWGVAGQGRVARACPTTQPGAIRATLCAGDRLRPGRDAGPWVGPAQRGPWQDRAVGS